MLGVEPVRALCSELQSPPSGSYCTFNTCVVSQSCLFSFIILDRHWQRAISAPLAFLFVFPVIMVLTVLKEAFQVVCGFHALSIAPWLWRIQSALDFSKNVHGCIASWWCYWQDAETLVGFVGHWKVTLKLINLTVFGGRLVFWVLPLVLACWCFLLFSVLNNERYDCQLCSGSEEV